MADGTEIDLDPKSVAEKVVKESTEKKPGDQRKSERQKVEVEEGVLNVYMDEDQGVRLSDIETLRFLRERYDGVKSEYKILLFNKRELEARKDEEGINRLTKAFRDNYKSRKWVVTELRLLGMSVEDRFIPVSAV